MKLIKPAAVAVSAVALAVLPSVTAAAHGGGNPFKNCTAAYDAGHSNIPASSPHYGTHLDRDGDGIGCDKPPADFVPAPEEEKSKGGEESSGAEESTGQEQGGTELAETGGDDTTPYIAGAGVAVLLAGVGLVAARRRRATTD
ncbi:excalibur calcium-binding domain-containing protein [Streptomyces sp. TRM 70361]|uniref:excalibur calcium-binding domain-containing protein n=1 Tax=Streptomyces sp. TRM 70361 TaxID=3116553 RepID=UPI002E7B031E|nr:excalibur calcium-binding domain-containing protein [Streptomyces sp. TRM 70361]MEE1938399.1 excalibur calcium-binding domain-containing protein [Streptomyces sp. TRM 70361]